MRRHKNPDDVLGLWKIDLANQDPNFERPVVVFLGGDHNAFALVGVVASALRNVRRLDLANEINSRIWLCAGYDEVMRLIREYVIVADDYLVH